MFFAHAHGSSTLYVLVADGRLGTGHVTWADENILTEGLSFLLLLLPLTHTVVVVVVVVVIVV